MGGAGRGQFWANDDEGIGPNIDVTIQKFQEFSKSGQTTRPKLKGIPKAKATATLVKNRKIGGEGLTVQRTHVEFDYSDEEETKKTSISGKNWLKSKVDSNMSEDEDEEDNDMDEDEEEDERAIRQRRYREASANAGVEEDLLISGRLFIRNLPFSVSEEQLEKHFANHGEIADVHIPLDSTKKPKGIGFVSYVVAEHAVAAMQAVDNTIFQGRIIHILPARRQVTEEEKEDESNFKKKREEDRRKQASKGEDGSAGWGNLFIRADTAVEAAASRLGVSKGDILHKEEGNMAVRMALAETQAVGEIKRYLSDNGVNMDAFQGKRETAKRSKSVIMVKNLPFDCDENQVTELFQEKGDLGRVILTPNRALALVEFIHPQEARLAFRRLAYKKFKHTPLYLEWAPESILVEDANVGLKQSTQDTKIIQPKKASGIQDTEKLLEAEEKDGGLEAEERSVYVKNLSFNTTEYSLRKAFRAAEGLRVVSIAKKRNTKDKSPEKSYLSMGFGFLEFDTNANAKKAIQTYQDKMVDGHKLLLKLSNRKPQGKSAKRKRVLSTKGGKGGYSSSKLIARNIAFQASRKELRELFGAYGQLKKMRLPRKFDGTHRGFCFVEYITEQEAKQAMQALWDTHLYGRHMVLEWAKKDESLEELRQRTVEQFESANVAAAAGIAAAGSKRGEKLTTRMFSKAKRQRR
ncbi:hypothetical protein AAMO2058_000964500 [Amorphochlora amoebiformis]